MSHALFFAETVFLVVYVSASLRLAQSCTHIGVVITSIHESRTDIMSHALFFAENESLSSMFHPHADWLNIGEVITSLHESRTDIWVTYSFFAGHVFLSSVFDRLTAQVHSHLSRTVYIVYVYSLLCHELYIWVTNSHTSQTRVLDCLTAQVPPLLSRTMYIMYIYIKNAHLSLSFFLSVSPSLSLTPPLPHTYTNVAFSLALSLSLALSDSRSLALSLFLSFSMSVFDCPTFRVPSYLSRTICIYTILYHVCVYVYSPLCHELYIWVTNWYTSQTRVLDRLTAQVPPHLSRSIYIYIYIMLFCFMFFFLNIPHICHELHITFDTNCIHCTVLYHMCV